MKRAILVGILCFLFGIPAWADTFLPYTDGRAGGCFVSRTGFMYGCTPQPPAALPPNRRSAAPIPDERLMRENAMLRDELRAQQDEAEQIARRAAHLAAEANAIIAEKRAEDERAAAVLRHRAAEQFAAQRAALAQQAIEERQQLLRIEKEVLSCKEQLAQRGYTVVAGNACKKSSGAYVTCPPCIE